MRLSLIERQGVLRALGNAFKATAFTAYLYGSRTDDKKKGGDIDLLVLVEPSAVHQFELEKHKIVNQIKKEIGDIRVDLTISCLESVEQDPFFSAVFPSAIRL